MKTQLLCTFCNEQNIDEKIEKILNTYEMVFEKIYVLENTNNREELFCTYNINVGNASANTIPNTISMHRKKKSNTLYTINALNEIVKTENNGHIDPNYMIDWDQYQNCIILTDEGGMKKINTSLIRIVDTNISKNKY